MFSVILALSTIAAAASAQCTPPGTVLHPNGDTTKCIDVRGAQFANGTPVQIYDCNGTGAQQWILNRGNGKVQVAGTNFCLDAGTNPGDGVQLKIWQCYDGLAAQQWFYTGDNRIALTGSGLCLDLTDGSETNANVLQTWQCFDGDTNQVWTSDPALQRRSLRYTKNQ